MRRNPRLGTRGSPLAMIQARKVASALEVAERWPAGHVEIVAITTSGDRITDRPLAEVGGKGLWTKELDQALLAGEIDFAVHSMKDVEVVRPAEIRLAAIRPRVYVADKLIGANSIDELRTGAVIGTSSPRRAAQVLALRPDLKIVPMRGNVETRIRKLEAGEADATFLSAAGLHRLRMDHIGVTLPFEVMLPAPGQGALGVECRADDEETCTMLKHLDDVSTRCAVEAERAFARALGGSCHSPVAALATVSHMETHLRAEILSTDGKDRVRDQARFAMRDCDEGAKLAHAMLERAPDSIRKLFRGE
ncbi:hydroxymethylbilane synthase [Sphingomonas sinipercae]|uniref:Porphobilinogen deaminase n=1 Tax=Sphingomonas sinipercae TaxID=2714944 RepID=A0A6G7ZKY1_9SPHN|nr:hydroxymethylbilane synthase [Sphingomonas sinipercae]QIL01578.1 hydroxymethylbilane synthase [Sphingomonas sinipercae]